MKKLSEFKGEKALDVIADLIEPCSVIFTDQEIVDGWDDRKARIKLAKKILTKYKKECIDMLCVLNECTPDEFDLNAIQILQQIVEIFNDEELTAFFD